MDQSVFFKVQSSLFRREKNTHRKLSFEVGEGIGGGWINLKKRFSFRYNWTAMEVEWVTIVTLNDAMDIQYIQSSNLGLNSRKFHVMKWWIDQRSTSPRKWFSSPNWWMQSAHSNSISLYLSPPRWNNRRNSDVSGVRQGERLVAY